MFTVHEAYAHAQLDDHTHWLVQPYQLVGMNQHTSKTKLLEAALHVIRAKGYTATRIEDICEHAKLTKGSFFHHFSSKEDLAVSAADYWSAYTDEIFAAAAYRKLLDPRERVLGYIAFRKDILAGSTITDFSCLVGTMVQEIYDESPAIRAACERSIDGHLVALVADLAAAKQHYAPDAEWDPEALAMYVQAVLQGAFILGKAKQTSTVVASCIDLLHDHVASLLPTPTRKKRR